MALTISGAGRKLAPALAILSRALLAAALLAAPASAYVTQARNARAAALPAAQLSTVAKEPVVEETSSAAFRFAAAVFGIGAVLGWLGTNRQKVASAAAASAVALAQAPALAEVDYVNIEYLGGSNNKVDVNNAIALEVRGAGALAKTKKNTKSWKQPSRSGRSSHHCFTAPVCCCVSLETWTAASGCIAGILRLQQFRAVVSRLRLGLLQAVALLGSSACSNFRLSVWPHACHQFRVLLLLLLFFLLLLFLFRVRDDRLIIVHRFGVSLCLA